MKKRPASTSVTPGSKPSCRPPSVWMYCLQDVGADNDCVGDGVTGGPWGVRDGDRTMSGKRRGFAGDVDCRTTCNGNGVNHNERHQVRNRSNTRMNSARSSARPGNDALTRPTPSGGAFLRVDGVTMRPEAGLGDCRPNTARCRGEPRRVKSAKAKAKTMLPATSRSLNIYSRSLSLTPDIYSLMHSPRDARSPRGVTSSKPWEDRCKPDTWSPNMSIPPPELTSNEWVKVLRANPGDPILQRDQTNGNARHRQKTRCRHRPVSAGFYETTRGSARHRTDSSDVSDSFRNLRLADGYDIPSLTRCRRPKTAGPFLWRASDFVGIAEPKSALIPDTPRTNRSAISVTKSALTPRADTPRSCRSTTISVTLPTTRDSCWVSIPESPPHEYEPERTQHAYPPKTPFNSPKGSVLDLSCGDSDEDTL